jgi:hypothetical protein
MGRIPFAFVLFTTIVNAGNFIPIQQGNSWTYRQENSTQQFTVKVGTPQQSGKLVATKAISCCTWTRTPGRNPY